MRSYHHFAGGIERKTGAGRLLTASMGFMCAGVLLRSPITWWIGIFMGMQALLFYCFVAWLPSILAGQGLNTETAGFYAFLFQFLSIPSSFLLPIWAEKLKDQKLLSVGVGAIFAVGALCLLMGGPMLLVGTVLGGVGCGASFGIGMAFLILRTSNSQDSAALSGVAGFFAGINRKIRE